MIKTITLCLTAFSLVFCSVVAAEELLEYGTLDTVNRGYIDGRPVPTPEGWLFTGTSGPPVGPPVFSVSSDSLAGGAPTPITNLGSGNPYDTGTGCGSLDCGLAFRPNPLGEPESARYYVYTYIFVLAEEGKTYTFSIWAGAESNNSGLIPGSGTRTEMRMEFLNRDQEYFGLKVLDLTAAGLGVSNGEPFNYKRYTLSAAAPVGGGLLFVGVGMWDAYFNPAGGGQALVFDDFSVIAVPEPMSAIFLFAAAGFIPRFRRR